MLPALLGKGDSQFSVSLLGAGRATGRVPPRTEPTVRAGAVPRGGHAGLPAGKHLAGVLLRRPFTELPTTVPGVGQSPSRSPHCPLSPPNLRTAGQIPKLSSLSFAWKVFLAYPLGNDFPHKESFSCSRHGTALFFCLSIYLLWRGD